MRPFLDSGDFLGFVFDSLHARWDSIFLVFVLFRFCRVFYRPVFKPIPHGFVLWPFWGRHRFLSMSFSGRHFSAMLGRHFSSMFGRRSGSVFWSSFFVDVRCRFSRCSLVKILDDRDRLTLTIPVRLYLYPSFLPLSCRRFDSIAVVVRMLAVRREDIPMDVPQGCHWVFSAPEI